jgi:hypothetical protein
MFSRYGGNGTAFSELAKIIQDVPFPPDLMEQRPEKLRPPKQKMLSRSSAGEIAVYGPSGYFSFMVCANRPLCR